LASLRMTETTNRPTRRLRYPAANPDGRLTHYLFRYPAKFHAPVVRQLIDEYTRPGDWLYDPFCGSGTLLVEALVSGRNALGSDVDPVAVYVSSVKSKPLSEARLRRDLGRILDALAPLERSPEDYEAMQWTDLSEPEYRAALGDSWVPAIPNLQHWFRRYVIVDLARVRATIHEVPLQGPSRRFFLLVFASVIRSVSNADPVPVSGLEVTAHMKRRDLAGRLINPFRQWRLAATRAIADVGAFASVATKGIHASAFQADATTFSRRLRQPVDAVITSPPYHGAVDYYRRHQLEMYWLGLVHEHEERVRLLQRYIGRTKVAARHPLLEGQFSLPEREALVEAQMREVSAPRADAFRHYCVAMSRTFLELARTLQRNSPALFVVGHSMWRGSSLNTSDLFAELSQPYFELAEILDYPVKNRYMSYARRNGASIDHEYVLVLRRTSASIAGT